MKTIDILKESARSMDFETKHNNYKSIIVSMFTIIFSISIVFEIREVVGEVMFYLLTVFLSLFLIYNEYLKVQELKNFHKKKQEFNIYILLITFVISVGLSLVGMYFVVDATYKNSFTTSNNEAELFSKLDKELNIKIVEIESNNDIKKDPIYIQEYENLNFQKRQLKHVWKENERKEVLNKIDVIESNIRNIQTSNTNKTDIQIKDIKNQISEQKKQISKKSAITDSKNGRNGIIVYILLLLTLLNDFVAIMFAKETAEKELRKEEFLNSDKVKIYLKLRSFLKTWMLKKKSNDSIHASEIKNLNPTWDWATETTLLFNIMANSGIIEITAKGLGVFLVNRKEAIELFDTYFDSFLD